ncbi:tRNA modification GTPase [Aureivirga marina]|uniref:tRNA modification GTPase n=1 Tax=Aureivirga marina TaxID=1182451 RepID=UPI0018C9FC77|nr:tRNA modification GTPase [Aureivirga marina]
MKLKLLLALFICTINMYGQITFKKGYFINNNGEKKECLIKDVDWKNSPINFEYKFTKKGKINTQSIENVKEFGGKDLSTCRRFEVEIDKSSDNLSYLDHKRNPRFHKETLFLKLIVEGKANLYVYTETGLVRFFIEKEDLPITQLVYKRFRTPKNPSILRKNNYYKQQLKKYLICDDIKISKLENAVYTTNSLSKLFVDYNFCGKEKEEEFSKIENKTKTKFHLNIQPSFKISNTGIKGAYYIYRNQYIDIDFSNLNRFQFGLEAEIILPFNNSKWSTFLNPILKTGSDTVDIEYDNIEFKMTALELNLGLRHYMFLNKNSKLFINAFLSHDIHFNSSINFKERTSVRPNLEPKSATTFGGGFGLKLYDKFSGEVRIYGNKNFLREYISWEGKDQTISIILGYTLL